MFDVLCLGETAVDIITRPVTECSFSNKCSRIERISIQSGGDALNNAVDLAKLGRFVIWGESGLMLAENSYFKS